MSTIHDDNEVNMDGNDVRERKSNESVSITVHHSNTQGKQRRFLRKISTESAEHLA